MNEVETIVHLRAWLETVAEQQLEKATMGEHRIKRKIAHTRRVIDTAVSIIGRDHEFRGGDGFIPLCSAVLHDIGRFEQAARFDSFNDTETVDHGDLGHEVIMGEAKWLADKLGGEENVIRVAQAVKYHNKLVLEGPMADDPLTVKAWKLTQDADRIDIFKIVLDAVEGRDETGYALGDGDPSIPMDKAIVDNVLAGGDVPSPARYSLPYSLFGVLSWCEKMYLDASRKLLLEKNIPARLAKGFEALGSPDAGKMRLYAHDIATKISGR